MNTNIQNDNYYSTLNENLNKTVELLENELTQSEIIQFLQNGNIIERQVAALKITSFENITQANILLDNLIGQDGKIRETVSLKIQELSTIYPEYFISENACNILLNSVIDVNPNICRNIICTIGKLKTNKNFIQIFIPKLLKLTKDLTETVSKINFQNGKYKVNKEVFKLYWCLEALYEIAEEIDINILKTIINSLKNTDEYTIREKVAKILSKNFDDLELMQIQQELRFDENYYVRRF